MTNGTGTPPEGATVADDLPLWIGRLGDRMRENGLITPARAWEVHGHPA